MPLKSKFLLGCRQNIIARVYFFFWAAVLGTFVLRAAPELWRNVSRGSIIAPSSDASMDGLLKPLLRVSQPSGRLNQTFEELPRETGILFVSARHDARWDFVYSAVCYLVWPRQVERIELSPNEGFAGRIPAGSVAVFCGVPPPVDARHRGNIGPNLTVVYPHPM